MTFGRTRTQETGLQTDTLGAYYSAGGIYTGDYTFGPYQRNQKITRDSIHKNYPKEGGPFDSAEASIVFNDTPVIQTGTEWAYMLSRVRCTNGYTDNFVPISNFGACEDLGAAAWAKFRPAKPRVSGSVFLAELKSAPQMLFKRLSSFRNLGSNYLAYQFGWKPFLSDLRNWYESIIKIDRQIEQLCRDNGRWIRRRGDVFQKTETASSSNRASLYPVYGMTWSDCTTTHTLTERAWFSGAFRYYIPGLMSQKWGKVKAIQQLWDLEITPEQLYNLIPFSWLLDWFSNTGDVISNYMASVNESLVAKFAYIMYETSEQYSHQVTVFPQWSVRDPVLGWKRCDPGPTICSNTITRTNKNRAAAEPFGFDFSFGSLSGYQKSILLALGLANSRH